MFSVKKHGPAPVFLIWKLSFTNALLTTLNVKKTEPLRAPASLITYKVGQTTIIKNIQDSNNLIP